MVCFLQICRRILAGAIPAIRYVSFGHKALRDQMNQAFASINKNRARRKKIIV